MNKNLFSKFFSVEEVKSGANPNRKNAATIRISAIESDGVRYESVTSKNHPKYFLKFTHLEAILLRFEENPKSITDSVNRIWSKAGLPLEHVTEAYSYGIARTFLEKTGVNIYVSHEELDREFTKIYTEGEKVAGWVERSKRAAGARSKCIEHFGAWCQGCRFEFESTYGAIGKGFIEVHHRKPISRSQGVYKINPTKDLIPLCSNCHAMVHRKSKMLSIVELRWKVKQAALRQNR